MAMASAPVTRAVTAAIRNDQTIEPMATPPKICVMEKIGTPLRSRAKTKNRRLKSEPKTIWALVSGVLSRMSYVWLSFSCVIAPAVKIGASRATRPSWR